MSSSTGTFDLSDQQLNHLDRVRMRIKQCDGVSPNISDVGHADIIDVCNEEKDKLRMYFKKLCCRFSLMIINVADGKYSCFMVCFIDDDWKLKTKLIGCMEGDQNMEVLKNVLSDLGIDNKIFSMVTNVSNILQVLSSDERENRFSGPGSLLSNCKFCIPSFHNINMTYPNSQVLRDHMSKISKYITETSSKILTFQIAIYRARSLGKEVTAEDIPTEEMLETMNDVQLRKIALGLKEAFFELEKMDLHFKSINLTKDQWAVLTIFYQDRIYWDLFDRRTANMYFPLLCCLYKKSLVFMTCWNSLISGERCGQFVRDAKKCWDEYNLILAVAAVLDPRFKMDIVKHWYEEIHGDKCDTQFARFNDYFNGVYNEYAAGTNNFLSSTSGSKKRKSSISSRMLDISGYPSDDPDSGHSLDSELHQYLKHANFPLRDDFDLLEWWRLNSRYFPTLAQMARDFLSIRIKVLYKNLVMFEKHEYYEFDSDVVKEAFLCTKNWLTDEEYE